MFFELGSIVFQNEISHSDLGFLEFPNLKTRGGLRPIKTTKTFKRTPVLGQRARGQSALGDAASLSQRHDARDHDLARGLVEARKYVRAFKRPEPVSPPTQSGRSQVIHRALQPSTVRGRSLHEVIAVRRGNRAFALTLVETTARIDETTAPT